MRHDYESFSLHKQRKEEAHFTTAWNSTLLRTIKNVAGKYVSGLYVFKSYSYSE